MKAALLKFLKNKLKKTAANAAAGDESSQRTIGILIATPIVASFVILVVIISAIFGPILMADEYIRGVKSNLPNFLQEFINSNGWCGAGDSSCEKQAEQEFYEKLSTVNENADVDLITATITYGLYVEPDLYSYDENGHNQRFIKYYCDSHAPFWIGELGCEAYVENNYDDIYSQYKDKYVKIYSNYKQLRDQYCVGNDKISSLIDITSYLSKVGQIIDIGDTLIGEGCELTLWEFSDLSTAVLNTDKSYNVYKYGKDDIDKLVSNLFVGRNDYDRYRNYLISTYIPENYSDAYINATNKDKAIEAIADEIMSFASKRNEKTMFGYNSLFASCSHVTIRNGGSIEVHELEEYVAGVTAGENGGAGPEALKMQAILARSFAVKNCNRTIDNSQKDQVYRTPTEATIEAANATAGLVLTFEGDILSEISFASYPRANYRGGFPGYEAQGYICSGVDCSTGSDGRQWCTTTLYKQPNMENYQLVMPDTTLSGGLWNGAHLPNQSGHCYGVSQVATRYFESERGFTYDQMIQEFFSSGVEIMSIYGGFGNYNGQIASTKGAVYLPYELDRFLGERGSSAQAFTDSIRNSVLQAGPGTRAGVVAAANTLISGLAQYGVKLPYISSTGASGSASGKYSGYGVLPDWGKHGAWWSGYYGRTYRQTGLDCSGFVAWSIHNGGFINLSGHNSGSLHYDGTPHAYGSVIGQPGDLLWHSGHIGLILGIGDDGKYIVGEEAGDPNGLVVTYYDVHKSYWSAVVDMSGFYSTPSNLDLAYYGG